MSVNTILFLGLGRIGLPEALVFANRGFKVLGYDPDNTVVEGIKNKEKPFDEAHIEEYISRNIDTNLFLTSDQVHLNSFIAETDVIIFAMGTRPIHPGEKLPELKEYLTNHFKMFDQIFTNTANQKREIVLIIRTTFPLGGTDALKSYIEKKYQLTEGKDFHMAFVPERLVEGHAIDEEESIPKIIGAYTDKGYEIIRDIFKKIGGEIIRVKNPISAEFCKLTDNTFRNTIFAYANDLAMHAAKYDIDILQVIDAVNNHYGRNKISKPGFVSGYCLGKDPYIFEMDFFPTLANRDFHSLWYYGRQVNDHLINYAADRVVSHLKKRENGKLAILGLSFKEDVDDFRMSDAFLLIDKFIEMGVRQIRVYDPNLDHNKYTQLPTELLDAGIMKTDTLTPSFFEGVDAIVISHPHHDIVKMNEKEALTHLLALASKPVYIFDPTGAWRMGHTMDIIQYEGIGFK